jgi:hypothetical protein
VVTFSTLQPPAGPPPASRLFPTGPGRWAAASVGERTRRAECTGNRAVRLRLPVRSTSSRPAPDRSEAAAGYLASNGVHSAGPGPARAGDRSRGEAPACRRPTAR